jgi:hypothetical protein
LSSEDGLPRHANDWAAENVQYFEISKKEKDDWKSVISITLAANDN